MATSDCNDTLDFRLQCLAGTLEGCQLVIRNQAADQHECVDGAHEATLYLVEEKLGEVRDQINAMARELSRGAAA